jgi:hypothetical protein
MIYPPPIDSGAVAEHFRHSLEGAKRDDWPYRHWILKDIYPEALCAGILALPIDPPRLGKTDGTRGTYNSERCFFTPYMRKTYAACAALCDALQRPDVAKIVGETCDIDVEGAFLRMEYIQDVDGAWLEPHHDIPEKLFSMVIYLCLGPDAKGWGTDIYDSNKKLVGSSSAEFDSAVIFIPGENTWHGFEPRKIVGVRRLMEINYVRPSWRSREQLSFPDRPIKLS